MDMQKNIRDRLNLLINNEGINQKFISTKTCISQPNLSKYRHGTYDLRYIELNILDDFLKSKGY